MKFFATAALAATSQAVSLTANAEWQRPTHFQTVEHNDVVVGYNEDRVIREYEVPTTKYETTEETHYKTETKTKNIPKTVYRTTEETKYREVPEVVYDTVYEDAVKLTPRTYNEANPYTVYDTVTDTKYRDVTQTKYRTENQTKTRKVPRTVTETVYDTKYRQVPVVTEETAY